MKVYKLLLKLIIVIFLFITCSCLEEWQHGNSICKRTFSKRVSRWVPYIETYRTGFIWRKTKTRYNYRWEFQTEWYTEDACCYGYSNEDGLCMPICIGGCPHGLCVRPNECSCDIGYSLKVNGSHQTCEPHCSLDCVMGGCTAPNTCTCNDGYELLDDGYTCKPFCKPNCDARSICVAPNNCACVDGYQYIDGLCEPICETGCDKNSYCFLPNLCDCKSGFIKDFSDQCVPYCRPPCGPHSHCISPDTCTCEPGYIFNDTYFENQEYMNQCDPVCLPSCGPHGICTAPDSCSCKLGYALITGRNITTLEKAPIICEPICNPPCGIRGDCIAPDICSCERGWKIVSMNLHDSLIDRYCAPHCDPPCAKFSSCIKPNKCDCDPGYLKSDRNDLLVCQPICEATCINATCIYPNTCECHVGYHPHINDSSKCEPTCGEFGCYYGTCIAPDVCSCDNGYQLSNNASWTCEPICKNCTNGICIEPDNCICNLYYEKNENDSCVPSCYGRCTNGTCVAPNQCACDPGYTLQSGFDDSNSPLCIPFCESGCPNGTCTEPEICTCDDGFVINDLNECIPNCDEKCNFGICVAPNQCKCEDGYVSVSEASMNMCQPVCENGCFNGYCTTPNNCTCNEGFVTDLLNQSNCIPICEKDCGHGDCIEPNKCECHDGYIKGNNTGLKDEFEVCVNPCFNECGTYGICNIENRTCDCFYGWTGEYCDTALYCGIIQTIYDDNLLQWVANRNERNHTSEDFQAVNWHGPTCSHQCILGSSDNIECFRLLSDNRSYENNHGYVCFFHINAICNSANLNLTTSNLVYFGAVGTILFIIAIVAIFLVIKRRRQRNFTMSVINSNNLLEQPSDPTESLLCTEENF